MRVGPHDLVCKKVYARHRLLNRLSSFLPKHAVLRVYKQTIMPIFDYGCIVWMACTKHVSDKIEKLQNRAMRIILKTDRRSCSQGMRSKLQSWQKVNETPIKNQ